MNYLAHAFLSFNNADILAGNMICDFVKGKTKFDYPVEIQKGIHLHRLIDGFTDSHEVTAKAKEFFRPQYRLYSGAFIDIVYDHFLARDEKQFDEYGGLENFTHGCYQLLDRETLYFPQKFQKMFPHMKTQNWLYNYRLKEGVRKSFGGLVYRAAYLFESDIAFQIFNDHYSDLENCYANFFPELKAFTFNALGSLLAK
ncbi:MAG: ACP phosphodiesterase [Bacteroidota bacterium]|nr:ACP phosphodiesterase [Bacteroidota bacterium]